MTPSFARPVRGDPRLLQEQEACRPRCASSGARPRRRRQADPPGRPSLGRSKETLSCPSRPQAFRRVEPVVRQSGAAASTSSAPARGPAMRVVQQTGEALARPRLAGAARRSRPGGARPSGTPAERPWRWQIFAQRQAWSRAATIATAPSGDAAAATIASTSFSVVRRRRRLTMSSEGGAPNASAFVAVRLRLVQAHARSAGASPRAPIIEGSLAG